ncbi:NmrA/HSCARG family protein [Pseudoroseomonas ludipueritiae]|uniref:NmrA/HSCARG family protein n=1 Tax=Pseudoroseomonas ludipueritiae TaxID=198093 RepID=A0ABR7R393_9PROT|nr:NmrA/HSCARG family protein [Pseudoroseomonas ludipueritiae]MBC9176186.1 NmrA/HSCARG family protein [Pseudoroseomonas ludipueritiae]
MPNHKQPILVFGATGQQGGSVASALLKEGWPVRAFVRSVHALKSTALREVGAELMQGNLADVCSIRSAMRGVHGVFSVQPSSGQGALYGVSDEDEVRFGTTIADIAVESGVRHLVYSSSNAVGDEPTGMGHFDSKACIEAHVRTLPIATSIIRPAAFMEMLMMPGFGLDKGCFNFFMRPDQPMQLVAVEDIGRIVAALFADPLRFEGSIIEIASDVVTVQDLEELLTQAAGKPISYSRFSSEVLAANPFLAKLTDLVDEGRLTGYANFEELRRMNPRLMSFRCWLSGCGREAFEVALGAAGAWRYGPT